MIGTIAFVLGILLAAIVLAVVGRRIPATNEPPPQTDGPRLVDPRPRPDSGHSFHPGHTIPTREQHTRTGPLLDLNRRLVCRNHCGGAGTLKKRDRHWPTWIGLIAKSCAITGRIACGLTISSFAR